MKEDRFRIGEIKGRKTPRFFMINNFGGGGTNVSRFLVYLPLFKERKSELLLNYYYLNTRFEKTPAFNTKILQKLNSFDDIRKFIEYARKRLIENDKSCLHGMRYEPSPWDPLVLLDSGSGNIFRDLLKQISETNFEKVFISEIKDYMNFCETLKFDMAISLDIAGKYTWKKGENLDGNYVAKLKKYSEPKWNLALSQLFLKEIPEPTNVLYYVAVHGHSQPEYLSYLNAILEIEHETKRKFAGIAIGGLGNLADDTIYDIVSTIRNRLNSLQDNRPIHVLGVGSVQNIIPLSLCGADTFDCHSPWRRASEDKLIVPLLNSDLEVIAEDNTYWKYTPIGDIEELHCDCEVCKTNSLSELKKIKKGNSEESIYFRILAYKHNVHQQEVLCKLLRSKINVNSVIEKIPQSKYKEKIKHLLSKSKINVKYLRF
jgi:tRNA-guanine family transglycosylase